MSWKTELVELCEALSPADKAWTRSVLKLPPYRAVDVRVLKILNSAQLRELQKRVHSDEPAA